MDKYIAIDLGGVLIDVDGSQYMLENIDQDLTINELWKLWCECEPVKDFEEGKIGFAEFCKSVVRCFDMKSNAEDFASNFRGWVKRPTQDARDLLVRIKESQFKLVTLSNSNCIHWETISSFSRFLSLFDCALSSHEIGVRKPNILAFKKMTSYCKFNSEVIFFDDREENVIAAQKFGFSAYRVSSVNDLRVRLMEFGYLK